MPVSSLSELSGRRFPQGNCALTSLGTKVESLS